MAKLSDQKRRYLEQVIEHFENEEWLVIEGRQANVRNYPSIPTQFIEQLIAGGWLVEVRLQHAERNIGPARWRLAPGSAWWNEKQQEHAEKLANASNQLNETIGKLTRYGVVITIVALAWSIISFCLNR